MIKQVVKLSPQLKANAFANLHVFKKRDVPNVKTGALDDISTRIAGTDLAGWNGSKTACIEPLRLRMQSVGIGVTNRVGSRYG